MQATRLITSRFSFDAEWPIRLKQTLFLKKAWNDTICFENLKLHVLPYLGIFKDRLSSWLYALNDNNNNFSMISEKKINFVNDYDYFYISGDAKKKKEKKEKSPTI